MPETELGEVEGANEAVDRPNRIVQTDIVLDPGRKQTGLLAALAALERAIRHKPNRTCCSRKCPPFLPSLDGQITELWPGSDTCGFKVMGRSLNHLQFPSLVVELLYRIEVCIHFRQCVKQRRLRDSQVGEHHARHRFRVEKRCCVEMTMVIIIDWQSLFGSIDHLDRIG